MTDTETPIIATEGASSASITPSADTSTPVGAPTAISTEVAATSTTAGAEVAATTVEPAKTEAPSLLAAEPVKEAEKSEVKVEEKKVEAKTEEKKPAEGEAKPEVAPEAPKYEAWKLPEGFKADEKTLGEFSGLLGQLEIAKGDHASTQEVGQKLVDLFHSKLGEVTQGMTDFYKQEWEKQKSNDFAALQKDPVLGGDSKAIEATARNMANRLAAYGGTKEEVTNFRKDVQARGVDNLPSVARVINNLLNKIDSYENESSKMLPGTKPAISQSHPGKNILQTMYGKKA